MFRKRPIWGRCAGRRRMRLVSACVSARGRCFHVICGGRRVPRAQPSSHRKTVSSAKNAFDKHLATGILARLWLRVHRNPAESGGALRVSDGFCGFLGRRRPGHSSVSPRMVRRWISASTANPIGTVIDVAAVAQLVECVLGKDEVTGSIPVSSFGRRPAL